MKRLLALTIAALLCISLAACGDTGTAPQETAPEPDQESTQAVSEEDAETADETDTQEGQFVSGEYEATVPSMKGDLTVRVSVDDTSIVSVEVTAHEDTPGIADAAIDTLTQKIVDEQSVGLDVVTGATVTSGAILSGTRQALEEAGGDMDALTQKAEKAPIAQGEDQQADILIIGGGGSGLSAALQATNDTGLNVVVVEKLAYTGGSTRVAGGVIWMNDTPYNEEADVNFDGDYLVEFMEERSDMQLNRPLLHKIAEISPGTIEYLMENGMPLNTEANSLGHPDSKLFTMSPPDSGSGNGGYQICEWMEDLALSQGVDIRLNTKATSLIIEDGAVVGAQIEDGEQAYTISASKIILATGGFTRNESLIEELAPEFTKNIPFTGAGSDGDGITMTRELDVPIVGGGMMGLKVLNPNLGYYGDIGSLVNHPSVFFNIEGNRFANEKVFYSEITYPLNEQTDKLVYGIVDSQSEILERLDRGVEMGLVYKADTLEEIAALTGMDEEAFLAGMQAYNDVKASGEDDPDFGVSNEQMVSIEQAPFYAVPIRPGFIGSIPGLQVDENCAVLNSQGEVVPNLYACGELIFGNIFSKWYAASGTGVGSAVYTGTIAGTAAVEALASGTAPASESSEEEVDSQEEEAEDAPVEEPEVAPEDSEEEEA